MNKLLHTLPVLSLAAALSLSGCAGEGDAFGPPGADELADLGVGAVPAYAMSITSTIFMCETDNEGECKPDVEEDSATVTLTAAVDVSGDPIVLPCTASGQASKKFDIDSDRLQRVPSGAARASVDDGSLDMQLAFLIGVDLEDPFDGAMPSDKNDPRVVDHDRDSKEGMTFKHWLGSIRFGARIVVETLDLDPTLQENTVVATLPKVDYAIFSDSIPFINVANKVDEYMSNHKKSRDDTSASFVVIEEATCAAVARAR